MIEEFTNRLIANETAVRLALAELKNPDYTDLVRVAVGTLNNEDVYESPDPERITRVDYGDYQGTAVFIIGATGYQPSKHWVTSDYYGSCSGCDALQAAQQDRVRWGEPPTKEVIDDYWRLTLGLVQRMVEI